MRNVLFAAVLVPFVAGVSATVAAPAHAEPLSLGADGVRALTSQSAPESPLAAFERLFARRVSVLAAPPAPPTVDPLDAPFHAALWSRPIPAKVSAARAPEMR